ncbi:hypothetical protein MAPG_05821 [Magnaporthiopsis poae ATCC 64411]|uniref:Uncharacterized protein n=1 Tax=Magnaporthiopsis poae (strain ATCC 64411 / 73-15) TaxID=644358 RepID=A0A0C4E0E8_MAGP6|nr:hypothetical protein MAPG_05821 [Magnaporthiopsis poae ATCC 64411]
MPRRDAWHCSVTGRQPPRTGCTSVAAASLAAWTVRLSGVSATARDNTPPSRSRALPLRSGSRDTRQARGTGPVCTRARHITAALRSMQGQSRLSRSGAGREKKKISLKKGVWWCAWICLSAWQTHSRRERGRNMVGYGSTQACMPSLTRNRRGSMAPGQAYAKRRR